METALRRQIELPLPIVEPAQTGRAQRINNILKNRQTLAVVLEGLFNPNNIGAIMRTCDAFGVKNIFYIGDNISNLNRRRSISSTGVEKWVEVKRYHAISDCYDALHNLGYAICTTYGDDNSPQPDKVDFTKPTAIVFGHEHNGISEEARRLADFNIRIPMRGFVKCMNVSVACGVILYEAIRQRTTT